MANTHHTGIPKLQWSFEYPPCTPSVTIVADKNPFCAGYSVTFTPTFNCVEDITITAYGWVVNGTIQSTSSEPFVSNTLTNNDTVYLLIVTNNGQTYFSNVIPMQEKTEGCITEIHYGLLYNWYAATDARKITSSDVWSVPSKTNWETLITYLGGSSVAGGKLKETGITYWSSPNEGATNEVGFNALGSGVRYQIGYYIFQKERISLWASTLIGTGPRAYDYTMFYDNTTIPSSYFNDPEFGLSIRLFRSATEAEQLLADGTACEPYTGNDGKIYRTVKIGTQVWLADNLAETKYRNGDLIPEVTDNAAWAALTTGALCAYNNSWDNV